MRNKPLRARLPGRPLLPGGATLYCFSPPVMAATLLIETTLLLWTLGRRSPPRLKLPAAAALAGLALFQLAEYSVCTGGEAQGWSRIGFATISTLPPLGLHILHAVAGKSGRRLLGAAYASMAAFIVYFLSAPAVFCGHECNGNYVIFKISAGLNAAYAAYYFGWLLLALTLGARWAEELAAQGPAAAPRLKAVRGLMLGYLAFLLPTAALITVLPATRDGVPSIMCGFAVTFSLILALYVLPRAEEGAEAASSVRRAPRSSSAPSRRYAVRIFGA